jgi:divinyl protochlorophyllide a 8-vinyl-reductase
MAAPLPVPLAADPAVPAGDGGRRAAERIGPNAVNRLAEALAERVGPAAPRRLFESCGLACHLESPPAHMVDEREVAMLHRAVATRFDPATAQAVARSAGVRTADYLLAKRIPRPVQWLLRALPPRPASRLLLQAIGRNAWTFVGSGRFLVTPGAPLRITIADCPLCRDGEPGAPPACAYYAATFERLFRVLVAPTTEVGAAGCMAAGAPACAFDVTWR